MMEAEQKLSRIIRNNPLYAKTAVLIKNYSKIA